MSAKPKANPVSATDDDALTDHEWRLKMAAEGKAIYIPGRSVEPVKKSYRSIMDPTKANNFEEDKMINVSMTDEQWDKFEKATGEVPYLLTHASNIFTLLYSVYGSGIKLDDPGFVSMFELCGRAFKNAAEQEGESIAELDRLMRNAMSDNINKSLQRTE